MKRRFVVLLCCMLPVLTACGQTGEQSEQYVNETAEEAAVKSETVTEREVMTETETESETIISEADDIETISLGEKIISASYEFTLNKVELSYDVMPDNPPKYYSHYAANTGEVYIHIDADVKNTQKQNIDCDEIYSVKADYDDGYTYSGFPVVEDSDGDFTYANIKSLMPLQTLGIHYLITCPEEVESSGKPLFIIITLDDGTQYKYVVR